MKAPAVLNGRPAAAFGIEDAAALVDAPIAKAWAETEARIAAIPDLSDAERAELLERAKTFVLEERERQRLDLIGRLRARGWRVKDSFAAPASNNFLTAFSARH